MSYSKKHIEIAKERTIQAANIANEICNVNGRLSDAWQIAVFKVVSQQLCNIDEIALMRHELDMEQAAEE